MNYTPAQTDKQAWLEHLEEPRLHYDVAQATYERNWYAFVAEWNRRIDAVNTSDLAPTEIWKLANELYHERGVIKDQALAILRAIRKIDAENIPF